MRILRNALIVVVLLIAAAVALAYVLPREVTVERSIVVDAPPAEVFPYVNSLQRTAEWSPWLGLDPEVALSYEGPEAGVGNAMSWASQNPSVGSGRQEITASEADRRVETALDFGEMGGGTAWLALDPEGAGTKVTWGLRTDMGLNPVGRWMGLMMDGWVGADYERGLQNLKALVEAG
jgi:hypothetical protein